MIFSFSFFMHEYENQISNVLFPANWCVLHLLSKGENIDLFHRLVLTPQDGSQPPCVQCINKPLN